MSPKIRKHFQKVDPVLYRALEQIRKTQGEIELKRKLPVDEYFAALVDSIISQQLSGKAADIIFNRFLDLLPSRLLTPQAVLKIPDQKLRNAGMSWGKVSFIKDLAQKVNSGYLVLKHSNKMTDEGVIAELTQVKGIGRWTAEMFLMFTLGREDLFSHGDLGLKNAIKKLYRLENPTKDQVEQITLKWSPYRTHACRILWKSLDL